MESPNLATLQNWFRQEVTKYNPSNQVSSSPQGSLAQEFLQPCNSRIIANDPPLTRKARLAIYSYAWYIRQENSLRDDYTVLAGRLGKRVFRRLVQDYLKEHPSRTHTLIHLGDALPEFLQAWSYPKKEAWHFDLAYLERCIYLSFFAADPTPWSLESYLNESPEKIAGLRFTLESPVFLFQSNWDLEQVWEKKKGLAAKVESHYLVNRQNFKVNWELMEEQDYLLLDQMRKGHTLGEILETEFPENASGENALVRIVNWAKNRVVRPV